MADSPFTAPVTHCRDFSRSQLLKSGLATAGNGLPSIEQGMPMPAGTGLSRRAFLARSAGLAMTVFGAQALAPAAYEEGLAAAMAAAGDGRILVSIYLAGGLDGLSVLAPVNDPTYRSLRPHLAVPVSANPDDVFTEDTRLQWHPSAAKLRTLHREGKVSVLPAVGYANNTMSHFTSRHYWEVGETDPRNLIGWMGRYLDVNGTPDNPLQGLTLGYSLQPSLAPASSPVSTIADPTSFSFWAENIGNSAMLDEGIRTLARMGAPATGDNDEITSAKTALSQLSSLKDTLGPLQGLPQPFQTAVSYPTTNHPFPSRLQMLAELISRGLPLRCVALQSAGGYDVHANFHGTMGGWLRIDCESIYAFQRDLEARGIADRVLIHVWSEFGRRVPENGIDGCDHGDAGISFVIGTQAQGQMVGEFPGVDVLDHDSNLLPTSDYRGLYCSLLEQWLGADPDPIIPGASGYARMQLVKA
jgi:uncharacterized protein (DUF1501 family)